MLKHTLSAALGAPAVENPPARVWRDWALVGALVPTALLEGFLRSDVVWRPLAIVFALGAIGLTFFRRTDPLKVTVATFGTVIVTDIVRLILGVDEFGLNSMGVIVLMPYALFRWASGRDAAIGTAVILTAATLGFVVDWNGAGEAVAGLVFLTVIFELGLLVRQRDRVRERDLDEARWKEREQLARELHDTVAHHVSGIAVQAQAGRAVGPDNPQAALDALATIEEAASRTLLEMREIVRVLRSEAEAELTPQPGVDDLMRFAAPIAGTIPVSIRVSGNLEGLPPSVGATLYRLTQEAITNARRHARQASRIDVSVVGHDLAVRLEVLDDGIDAPHGAEPGFGLVGMAERAKLIGGTLEAGPGPQQGWRVAATLPRSGSVGG